MTVVELIDTEEDGRRPFGKGGAGGVTKSLLEDSLFIDKDSGKGGGGGGGGIAKQLSFLNKSGRGGGAGAVIEGTLSGFRVDSASVKRDCGSGGGGGGGS